jgi:hypothetical protein
MKLTSVLPIVPFSGEEDVVIFSLLASARYTYFAFLWRFSI